MEAKDTVEEVPSPRKRNWTKRELLEVKQQCQTLEEAADQVCRKTLPQGSDLDDDEVFDKFLKTCDHVRAIIAKVAKHKRAKKYGISSTLLDDRGIGASQYSIFDEDDIGQGSQASSLDMFADELSQSLPPRADGYQKQPLTQISRKAARARVQNEKATFDSWCKDQGCTVVQLAGLFVQMEYYIHDRQLAKVGWDMFSGQLIQSKPEVSELEAIWMRESLGLSRDKYTELKLRLEDRIQLPPAYKVSQASRQLDPTSKPVQDGVLADLSDCLKVTLSEHLTLLSNDVPANVSFTMTWGMDGSGDHGDYAYTETTSKSTRNVVSICFAVNAIFGPDGNTMWSSKRLGHNSPRVTRPWGLIPAKENDDFLDKIMPVLLGQLDKLKQGLALTIGGQQVQAECSKKPEMSMIDGRMQIRLLQLGGAYCTMCHFSELTCHDKPRITTGFPITRSIESITELANSLLDTSTGQIAIKPKDYEKRQGITGIPKTTDDLTKIIAVCHSKIHAIKWIMQLMQRQNSTKKWGSVTNPVRYSPEEKQVEKQEFRSLKTKVKDALGINIGDEGDMLKGPSFKMFSSDFGRDKLAEMIAEPGVREAFKEVHLGICVAVRVLNSQRELVDVGKYKEMCKETHLRIVETFKWAKISQSIHKVLAHSAELIEANEGYGLGTKSEEGLEGLNKNIRFLRVHGARKTSIADNFQDVFHHIWRRSSPLVVELDREKKSRKKTKSGAMSRIDSVVTAMFLNMTDPED